MSARLVLILLMGGAFGQSMEMQCDLGALGQCVFPTDGLSDVEFRPIYLALIKCAPDAGCESNSAVVAWHRDSCATGNPIGAIDIQLKIRIFTCKTRAAMAEPSPPSWQDFVDRCIGKCWSVQVSPVCP